MVFLGKGVRKICSKFTGEHPCRSAISVKLLCNFIEHLRTPIAAYFQNTFSQEHLWVAASELSAATLQKRATSQKFFKDFEKFLDFCLKAPLLSGSSKRLTATTVLLDSAILQRRSRDF